MIDQKIRDRFIAHTIGQVEHCWMNLDRIARCVKTDGAAKLLLVTVGITATCMPEGNALDLETGPDKHPHVACKGSQSTLIAQFQGRMVTCLFFKNQCGTLGFVLQTIDRGVCDKPIVSFNPLQ